MFIDNGIKYYGDLKCCESCINFKQYFGNKGNSKFIKGIFKVHCPVLGSIGYDHEYVACDSLCDKWKGSKIPIAPNKDKKVKWYRILYKCCYWSFFISANLLVLLCLLEKSSRNKIISVLMAIYFLCLAVFIKIDSKRDGEERRGE